ncbi:hypothetical protein PAI11_09510 [Patulibacter medicamentivorans]|uniref:Uncharacterized protein n=1 Tax=Patulibacter medicamentivorans TaxID=1097667 RepID=H0E2D8_9ACTN|nr:hypothetical protein PAI11_09510 [Patulibacter medicamentivorans]
MGTRAGVLHAGDHGLDLLLGGSGLHHDHHLLAPLGRHGWVEAVRRRSKVRSSPSRRRGVGHFRRQVIASRERGSTAPGRAARAASGRGDRAPSEIARCARRTHTKTRTRSPAGRRRRPEPARRVLQERCRGSSPSVAGA